MDRRSFMKQGIATTAAMVAAGTGIAQAQEAIKMTSPSGIPKREYGKTGVQLSIIGYGGIVVMNAEQETANKSVAYAFERGVNYYDVAPGYGDAEIKLGPALAPYRKDAFLACKTAQREREGAELEFKRSCERLQTDHFELYQLHGIVSVEKDVDPVFQKGGVMDMLLEKKKAGQIRFLGFSAHSYEAAEAAMSRYDFDSILWPVNFASEQKNGFGLEIVKKATDKGMSCLALKAMAKQLWPEGLKEKSAFQKCWYEPLSDPAMLELALRWTLSQSVAAAIPPGEEALFRMAMDAADRFTPITPAETETLKTAAAALNPIFQKTA